MQQHTGQHLLSSVFYKLYGAETIGFHISHNHVYIDITLKEVNPEIIKRVEKFTNKIIFSNFDIKTYFVDKNNFDKVPPIQLPNIDSNIRIVEIDGIDFTPCYGTHHRNTGEIGLIKIKDWTRNKKHTRVEFVCGYRALKDYSEKSRDIKKLSKLLASSEENLKNNITNLYLEKEKLEKENRILKKELEIYRKT